MSAIPVAGTARRRVELLRILSKDAAWSRIVEAAAVSRRDASWDAVDTVRAAARDAADGVYVGGINADVWERIASHIDSVEAKLVTTDDLAEEAEREAAFRARVASEEAAKAEEAALVEWAKAHTGETRDGVAFAHVTSWVDIDGDYQRRVEWHLDRIKAVKALVDSGATLTAAVAELAQSIAAEKATRDAAEKARMERLRAEEAARVQAETAKAAPLYSLADRMRAHPTVLQAEVFGLELRLKFRFGEYGSADGPTLTLDTPEPLEGWEAWLTAEAEKALAAEAERRAAKLAAYREAEAAAAEKAAKEAAAKAVFEAAKAAEEAAKAPFLASLAAKRPDYRIRRNAITVLDRDKRGNQVLRIEDRKAPCTVFWDGSRLYRLKGGFKLL